MKHLLMIWAVSFSVAGLSQTAEWYQGSLVLADNHVMTGYVSVQPAYDMVLFSAEGKISVFPSHRIKGAYFYDDDADINRKFTTIQQSTWQGTSTQLYEVVVYGPLKILRRLARGSSGTDQFQVTTTPSSLKGNSSPSGTFKKTFIHTCSEAKPFFLPC